MQKHGIMLLIIFGIVSLSIGYSAFNTELMISGDVKVDVLSIKDRILYDNGGREYIESKSNPDLNTIATIDEGMYSTLEVLIITTIYLLAIFFGKLLE